MLVVDHLGGAVHLLHRRGVDAGGQHPLGAGGIHEAVRSGGAHDLVDHFRVAGLDRAVHVVEHALAPHLHGARAHFLHRAGELLALPVLCK